jgi:hypothetical protein
MRNALRALERLRRAFRPHRELAMGWLAPSGLEKCARPSNRCPIWGTPAYVGSAAGLLPAGETEQATATLGN